MSTHSRSKKMRRMWGFLGLSSGLHAAGLLLLPALLGLGWWHWYSVPPGGPHEVRLAFAQALKDPLEVAEVPLEVLPTPDWEFPDLPELETDESWVPDEPSPEPDSKPLRQDSTPIDWSEALPSPAPIAAPPEEEPTEPAVEPEPAPAPTLEVPPGQTVDEEWEPSPWLEFCPAPSYPTLAQRRNWQGTALLRLFVGPDGWVLGVELLESSGYDMLDRAAVKALATWRFHPGPAGSAARSVDRRVQFRLP